MDRSHVGPCKWTGAIKCVRVHENRVGACNWTGVMQVRGSGQESSQHFRTCQDPMFVMYLRRSCGVACFTNCFQQK